MTIWIKFGGWSSGWHRRRSAMIASASGWGFRQASAPINRRELAGIDGFQRRKAVCAICVATKLVNGRNDKRTSDL